MPTRPREPACWVVEGFSVKHSSWDAPEVREAVAQGQPLPDAQGEWTVDGIIPRDYAWPKTLRHAVRTAESIRRVDLRCRGPRAAPLRLRNLETGEIATLDWVGRLHLRARVHVPGRPDSVIMPHRARLRRGPR
jgi:hypothetical protein